VLIGGGERDKWTVSRRTRRLGPGQTFFYTAAEQKAKLLAISPDEMSYYLHDGNR